MNILIIEDEHPAAQRLLRMIRQFEPSATLAGPLSSVLDVQDWLNANSEPDLIIADIQLTDGLTLDVFRSRQVHCPVVFATAYDQYLLESLEHNSIDYLLKPIKPDHLKRALEKYARLKEHFTSDLTGFLKEYFGTSGRTGRRRIIVKKGIDSLSIPVEDVAFFHTEHKVVFLVDTSGARYIVDTSLSDLELGLDKEVFYRVNRKFIVNISAIRKFKTLEKGRLVLDVFPSPSEPIIVSQENASDFKTWMGK